MNRPVTRNCDMKLIVSVWKNFHKKHFVEFIHLCMGACELDIPDSLKCMGGDCNELPGTESIRRVRQKFQQHGNYLPTDPKVIDERRKKIKVVQKDIRNWYEKDRVE